MSAERRPICGRPADAKRRPFCSPRCANVDLQRWLSERYVAPGSEAVAPASREDEDD